MRFGQDSDGNEWTRNRWRGIDISQAAGTGAYFVALKRRRAVERLAAQSAAALDKRRDGDQRSYGAHEPSISTSFRITSL